MTSELLPVSAHTQDDSTDLTLPLPNPFHQENALATGVDGSTSKQQPWELVSFSTGWRLAYSREEKSHVTEDGVTGLENAVSSPVFEVFPKECDSGAEVRTSQSQRE